MRKPRIYIAFVLSFSLAFFGYCQENEIIISTEILSNNEIKNLESINSKLHEFSPAFYKDGFLYVSASPDDGLIDEDTGEEFWDLFYAVKDENKEILKLGKFSTQFNTSLHEGPAGFNSKQSQIFFTRNRDIFSSAFVDGRWNDPQEINFSNGDFYYCHPTLREDDSAMIFASNMPGGFGKMDLYISFWNGVKWSLPQNLGPSVNTDGNELFPFWHSSGFLFFASDGMLKNEGGLDIFASYNSNGIWLESQNLGPSINSKKDDFGFILDEAGAVGYFSSNRAGGKGKDDIYEVSFKENITLLNQKEELEVTVSIKDVSSNLYLSGSRVEIISGNEKFNQQVKLTDSNGEIKTKLLKGESYIMKISSDGYITKTEIIDELIDSEFSVDMIADEVPCRNFSAVILNKNNQILNNANLKFRSSCLGESVESKTDESGFAMICLPSKCDYNIIIEREGYKPYTETFSIDEKDNNRPTRYTLEKIEEDKPIIKDSDLKKGAVIVLNNIYYEFGKYVIQAGAARELDQLARIMIRYPEMKIQLSAHTDSRGEESYNLDLSKKRATSAKEYLVQFNIEPDRIIAIGHGEQYIRNQCKEGVVCSEVDHQFNRRTEVRVIEINKDVEVKYNGGN